MNGATLDRGQLGYVAADVRAVGVEAMRLPERVERPPRARVRSRAGDPLPVADVVCDVAVDEPVEEVPRSRAPVDAQVAHEERRRDQPSAVVHVPLAQKLSHAGVNDRVAGLAVLPRLERLADAAPSITARTHVLVRRLRSRGEQLVEEVAPRKLAHEGRYCGDLLSSHCGF